VYVVEGGGERDSQRIGLPWGHGQNACSARESKRVGLRTSGDCLVGDPVGKPGEQAFGKLLFVVPCSGAAAAAAVAAAALLVLLLGTLCQTQLLQPAPAAS
jgi:hypothetical protein